MSKLSCVLITCDSEKNKGGSVFHVLNMILKQDFRDFELILVENSHNKNKKKIIKLKNYIRKLNEEREKPISISIINKKRSLNVNLARNLGGKKAQSDLLLFIEDDTIMLGYNYFSLIYRFSKKFDFGYGAKRLWTKKNWFQKKSDLILKKINNINFLKKYSGNIPNDFKDKKDIEIFYLLQEYTFIANFGFCKKDLFFKLGGFPLYKNLDLSDDCLMYRLFNSGAKYKFLGKLSVLHVSHYRPRNNSAENLNLYTEELRNNNHYWCHIHKTFKENILIREIIEPLTSIHYEYRLREIYFKYLNLYPLDIKEKSKDIFYWRSNNILDILDFSILMKKLIESDSLDDFVKKSCADFDNLAMFIKLAVDNNIIKIIKNGKIKYLNFFENYKKIYFHKIKFLPNYKLNQFPCDDNSRIKRAKFIINRYHFVEYLRFAIIGDDDFLSPLFKNIDNFSPIVLEKDRRIIKRLKLINKNLEIFNVDLLKESDFSDCKILKVSTFITDPPYTLNGALLFIMRGLSLLEKNNNLKEFYVILNPVMIGKNIEKIINILSSAGIFLHYIDENFSQYKLPNHYKERDRANKFLKEINLKQNVLKYSSSSNLYIFRTFNPNIENIKKNINFKEIYRHYL